MTIQELAELNKDFAVYDYAKMTYLGRATKGVGYNGDTEVKELVCQNIGFGARIVAFVSREDRKE